MINYKESYEIEINWVKYEGDFYNGQMNGVGVLTMINGERLKGTLINGRLQGTFTVYRHTGEIENFSL